MQATITRLLADSRRTGPSQLTVKARAERDPAEGFRVELLTEDGATHGKRVLRAESCQAAADATAFVVALAVMEGASGPHAATSREARPESPMAAVLSNAPEGPGRAAAEWTLGARTLFGTGALPSPTLGLGVVAGVDIGRLRLEAAAEAWLPRDATVASDPGAGATFRSYTADFHACYGPRFGALSAAGCVGARGGRISADAFGAPENLGGGQWLLGPLGGVLVAWRASTRWSLRIQAEVSANALSRPTFRFFDEEPVYRAPWLSGDIGMGVAFHF